MSVRVATPLAQAPNHLKQVLSVGLENRFLCASPNTGAHAEVRDSPVGGKGLFASQDMATGAEVARMIDPARMRRVVWNVYHTAMDCLTMLAST